MDADLDYINQQKQKLSDLVTERNQLIHHDIGDLDPNSPKSCQHWITRLDEQNERILTLLSAEQQLIDICRECFQNLITAMNTDEWKRGFRTDKT